MNENTMKNKKFQLIYNIFSGFAIIALFMLFFLKPGSSETSRNMRGDGTTTDIVYIDSDSLMNSYILVDTLAANLQRITDSLQKDLSTREQTFQARVVAYQQNMQNGTIQTIDQAKQQEAALQAEQEQLLQMSEQYQNQMLLLQNQMNYAIIDSVYSAIDNNPEEFPHDIILGYSKGAGIFYVNKELDITAKVVEVLNENYTD